MSPRTADNLAAFCGAVVGTLIAVGLAIAAWKLDARAGQRKQRRKYVEHCNPGTFETSRYGRSL